MIDITRALTSGHPNWPGDAPFSLTETASMADGSSVNLMMISTSTHCGTHLDAPLHYRADGGTLDSVPLETLIGPARVVDAAGSETVTSAQLPSTDALPPRVLFHTGQADHWQIFPEAFTPLTPDLIHQLADRGVRLVGTDCPSVDAFSSTKLPVHGACAGRGVSILEGLRLAGVAAGPYRLVCLPLNLPAADASPVRAVLLPPA